MVHLLPLPGSPRALDMTQVLAAARSDAEILLDAGFDGIVVENFGDAPFLPDRVEPVTIAALTRVAAVLGALCAGRAGLCVNVLRNDARAALAIASVCGANSIRVNIHSGARVADQGLIEGRAWETMRLRQAWRADAVALWADVGVKHSVALGTPAPRLVDEVHDVVGRGLADAVIVSGVATGSSVDLAELEAVKRASDVPVLVGSGANLQSIGALLALADGVIIGTALKVDGVTTAPVDPARAAALVAAAG